MMFSSMQILNINGDSDEALELALDFALKIAGREKIKAFRKDPKGLAFYCRAGKSNTTEYPFPATTKVLVEQIKDYIKNLSREELFNFAGPCPDIDGSVELGWELFYPLWYGRNELEEYDGLEILAVRPSWIVYAK